MAALHENRSRSAFRSTLAKGVLRERDVGLCNRDRNKVKGCVAILETKDCLALSPFWLSK